MDTETSHVIGRINARIDALETTLRGELSAMGADLRGEMSAMGADLRGEMSAMGAGLRGEMSAMRAELRGEMSAVHDDLRSEIRGSLAEAKRHAVILNEDVRDDIRILAENLAAMSVKLDSLQR